MDVEGSLSPETAAEAREAYDAVGPTAQLVVKEVAKAMGFDREEYRERVTGDVVETARDVLFAAELEVRVGSRDEYDAWREGFDGDVVERGSEHVHAVAWHVAPFAEQAVAATFQDERDAAVGTLRRQAYGEIYEERL
ncbi:hypothetical protein G9C85_10940 [Halorubellus sp. JP-L1]|uniref:DUF5809 family protein n=1 Tax=Halorubellus sp. JP-L1 TaxID=2715753 RepID=UPI00140B64BD|nr:DUF5809 family protein [Halorubellus sp. JP-L1]NHN42138.1 hypothetical protein [Halorubellus sp. JP-L1]